MPIRIKPPKISAFGPSRDETRLPIFSPAAEIRKADRPISSAASRVLPSGGPSNNLILTIPRLNPVINASMLSATPSSSVLRSDNRSLQLTDSPSAERPSLIILPPTIASSPKATQWS